MLDVQSISYFTQGYCALYEIYQKYMALLIEYINKIEGLGNGFFGQMWPFKYNLMQQAVSEKFMNNLLDTLSVSCLYAGTVKVKNLLNMNNSQVTKASNS